MTDDETCEVIYRDEHLVAVNKPSGLLVHRSLIDRHETRFALQLVRDQLGQHVYPVHRLDKPTSGVLLFGLASDSARRLSAQFAAGTVRKCYLAVVRGHCPEAGRIDHALKEEQDRIADRNWQQGRPPQQALTHYRRLATVEIPVAVERYPRTRYSLAELRPETGRRHQLRRHLKHIGYPIIGDAKHGKGVHNRAFQQLFDSHRLLLACVEMQFTHPLSQQPIRLVAPPAHDFAALLARFGWTAALPARWQASAQAA